MPMPTRSSDPQVFSFEHAMAGLMPDATVDLLPGHVRLHKAAQWMVGIKPYTDNQSIHSQYWERHPRGDEILTLLEGRLKLRFYVDGGETTLPLNAGQSVRIPQGCWHRLEAIAPGKLMFITPTTDSEHCHIDSLQAH